MKSKYRGLWIVGLLTLALKLPAQQVAPQRIISLAPSLTESLANLGVETRIVGVTSFCSRPASVKQIEKVASAVDVNVEKALMLKPDLIVTTKLSDIKDVRKLQALGLRVEIFDQPRNFDQLCAQFRRLGALTGRAAQADSLIDSARAMVAALSPAAGAEARPKALIQIGADPLFVATQESLMNDMLKRAGGINIAEHWGNGLASREKVLSLNPDAVFIVTMGVAGQHERAVWESYPSLKAAQRHAVHVVDAYLFCSPTPEGFFRATAILAEKLKSLR